MQQYNRRAYSGTAPDTTLVADIDDTTLTLSCADLTGWPDGSDPFAVILEPEEAAEEKNWGTRSGNTITLLARGMEGAAVAHAGTTTVVRHGYSALDAGEANYAASQTVGKVSAKGDLLQGTSANTLEPISVGSTGQALVVAGGKWVAGTPAVAEGDVAGLLDDLTALQTGKQNTPDSGWSKGSLLVGADDGTADTLPVGVDGAVLTADSTAPNGVAYLTAPSAAPLAHVDYTSTTASLHVNTSGSAVITVVDSTNLSPSFTAPASGKVLIRVSGVLNHNSSATDTVGIGWLNHSGGAQIGRTQAELVPAISGLVQYAKRFSCAQTLTGLTAGSLQLDLAIGTVNSSGNPMTLTDVTIEVWAAL